MKFQNLKVFKNIFASILLISHGVNAQVLIDQYTDTERHDGYYYVTQQINFLSKKDIDSFYESDFTKVRSYYNSSILKEEYSQKKEFKIGEYRSYYPNGRLNTFYTCVDGNKVDFYLEFYENGQKKVAGRYKIFEESPHFQYNRDTVYAKDSLTGFITNIITLSPIINDIKDGPWYYWDSVGNLIKKELWRRGKLVR